MLGILPLQVFSVLLVVTVVLLGGLTVSSGVNLIENARRTADNAYTECSNGSSAALQSVATLYLEGLMLAVEGTIQRVYDTPFNAVEEMATLAKMHHPDETLSTPYINRTIRETLRSHLTSGHELVGFFPTSGAELLMWKTVQQNGVILPDGSRPILCAESRNASGGFGSGSIMYVADTSPSGLLINTDKQCTEGPNYPAGGTMGLCIRERGDVISPFLLEVLNRGRDVNGDEAVASPLREEGGRLMQYVSVTFTYPEIGQNRRIGSFVVGVNMGVDVRKVLPNGVIMYAVLKDPWSKEVGVLMMTNVDVLLKAINVTEHAQNGVVSPIGAHGRYVFTKESNYSGLAESTEILPWTHNTTQYCTRISPLQRGNLEVFVALLVPRSNFEMDDTLTQIHANIESNRDDNTTHTCILLSIVGSIVLIYLMIAVVFMRAILESIRSLMGDMMNVAVMDLEVVELDSKYSFLDEIAAMEATFRRMVRSLLVYRNYLPQSVLLSDESPEEDILTTSGLALVRSFQGEHIIGSGGPSSANTITPHSPTAAPAICGEMKKTTITVVAFNIKNWHNTVNDRTAGFLVETHEETISKLFNSVATEKGICDNFSGDRLMATFNAYRRHLTHAVSAVHSAVNAREALRQLKLGLSFAVCSGEARIAHLGCNGLKKVTIVSSLLPWTVALERYNRRYALGGLADQLAVTTVHQHYELKCVAGILFPKHSVKTLQVFEVEGRLHCADAEAWMYQLETAEGFSENTLWNDAYEKLISECWEAAKETLSKLPPSDTEVARPLLQMAEEQRFIPDEIPFH